MTDEDDISRLETGDGMLARKTFKCLKMEATVYQEATNLQPPLEPPQPLPMPTDSGLPQAITTSYSENMICCDSTKHTKRKRTANPVAPKHSKQKQEITKKNTNTKKKSSETYDS